MDVAEENCACTVQLFEWGPDAVYTTEVAEGLAHVLRRMNAVHRVGSGYRRHNRQGARWNDLDWPSVTKECRLVARFCKLRTLAVAFISIWFYSKSLHTSALQLLPPFGMETVIKGLIRRRTRRVCEIGIYEEQSE
jgi:hypothetical protein